jgi:peptide deformylase
MFEIRIYGDPVLRKKAKPVAAFNEQFEKFVDEMVETMRVSDGVGLAATQVGKSIQVAVVDASGGEKPPYVLVNPRIVQVSEEEVPADEGCLSFPEISVKIKRPAKVTVEACNSKNEKYMIENAEGVLARALQHEIDHLNGILIVDHISTLQRQLLKHKLKELSNLKRAHT